VAALCEMVVDPDPHVRSFVTVAFQDRALVLPGNPEAVAGVAAQTKHADPAVREAALLALFRVADCTAESCDPNGVVSSPVAIEALKARLADPDGVVKKQAPPPSPLPPVLTGHVSSLLPY
jgi:HEAT repeat protein